MPADTNTLHIPAAFESLDRSGFRRLEDVTTGIFDCPHSTPKLVSDGPLVVRTQDIMTGVLRTEQAARVSEETYRERIVRAEPASGDLLYSREGTYFGIAAEVPSGTRLCLGQRMVLIRPDRTKVDTRYLKYWLNSPQIAAHINGFRDGSVAERLNLPVIRGLPVFVPELSEQQAIAALLGALDEKIEQNRRTALTLEALVRATFKAWFVDFEPVKAKASGVANFPGMASAAFSAVPDRLAESVVGLVPHAWAVAKLGDCCEINKHSVRPGEIDDTIEYVDIAAVTMGRLDGVQRVPFADAPSRARRRVRHGDTIWSCVRPNRRSYLFVHSPPTNRIVSTGFAVLSPSVFGPSYLHELTTRQEFVDYLVANADGSAYPAVRPDQFASADVLVPPAVVRNAFEEATMPLRDLLAAGEVESSKLAALRDYLLPWLLSGRIRLAAVKQHDMRTL